MPYILENKREKFKAYPNSPACNPGELNYLFTKIAIEYFMDNGKNYIAINDIVGALECCKLEFVRRVTNPYEDKKIDINGDCYPSEIVKAETKKGE